MKTNAYVLVCVIMLNIYMCVSVLMFMLIMILFEQLFCKLADFLHVFSNRILKDVWEYIMKTNAYVLVSVIMLNIYMCVSLNFAVHAYNDYI